MARSTEDIERELVNLRTQVYDLCSALDLAQKTVKEQAKEIREQKVIISALIEQLRKEV